MKIAYINSFPPKEFYMTEDWSLKLSYLAENTGNWVYINCLRKQIDYDIETWLNDPLLKDGYTVGVMPVSNILRRNYMGTVEWADAIEKLKFPVVLVGMGTQSPNGQTTPREIVKSLKPEVIRAFQRIADQCCSFGIRGEATAECLDIMGIHNYRIIGCPSFYQYLDGVFRCRKRPTKDRVVFSLTVGRKTAGHIFEMGMRNKGQWIMQGREEGVQFLHSDEKVSDGFVKEKLFLNKSGEELNNYIKSNAHIFFRQEEWEHYLIDNKFTFAFGMRFHGNMLAHLSGIPTMWIGHDLRTKELVSTLKLPNVTLEEYRNINDIDELIARCSYKNVEKNYLSMCKEYVKFLDENGIKHKFELNEAE